MFHNIYSAEKKKKIIYKIKMTVFMVMSRYKLVLSQSLSNMSRLLTKSSMYDK